MKFHWKANKSFAVDELEKKHLLENGTRINEIEKKKITKIEYLNIIDGEGHSRVLNRSFRDIAQELESSLRFPFESKIFSIIPMVIYRAR